MIAITAGTAVRNVPRVVQDVAALQRVKVVGEDGPAQEHVVPEVDEGLGQPRNVVQVELDRCQRKGGQERSIPENLVMADDLDLGMLRIQPGWDLAIGYDKHLVDPRRILLQGTQRVPEIVAVPRAVGGQLLLHVLAFQRAVGLHLPNPSRVAPVLPNVHSVNHRVTEPVAEGTMADVIPVGFRTVVRARVRTVPRVQVKGDGHSRKHAGECNQQDKTATHQKQREKDNNM